MVKNRKLPKPIAPPAQMRSRKRARIVTTLFHKNTRMRDEALVRGDVETVKKLEEEIEKMGGREEYQRASQLSTSYFSTSKWAIGVLGQIGWLHKGIPVEEAHLDKCQGDTASFSTKKKITRKIKLLEVGAINTELIDAAARTQKFSQSIEKCSETSSLEQIVRERPLYQLDVRAIDLRSSHEKIEEADFLKIPVPAELNYRFDAIVCSMVLNCVTTPQDRGKMLALLFHQLRPGGYCFLTIPKLCLSQSKYITKNIFNEMLSNSLGFEIYKTKESPKVSFWVLKRPLKDKGNKKKISDRYKHLKIINKGKKYKNMFSIILDESEVSGDAFK